MKKYFLILLIAAGVGASYSCYGDPEPGTGIVTVRDSNDLLVPSAVVQLSQPGQLGTGYIVVEGLTDMQGRYSYTHEPALEVILDISASNGPSSGQGIIRIKPNETTEETVKIYP